MSSDSNVNASAKRTEEKVGDGKYCSHSLDEVAGMLQSTLSAYGSEVNASSKIGLYLLPFVSLSAETNSTIIAKQPV